METLDRTCHILNRGVEYACFFLGAVMSGVVITQVFFRYALNHSLFWSEELGRFFLVWLTFLGATVAYRRRGHVSVDLIYNRLPDGGRRALAIITLILSLIFFSVMIYFGVKYAHFIRMQVSPALRVVKWIPALIIPLSGAIMLLHGINFLLREIRGERP